MRSSLFMPSASASPIQCIHKRRAARQIGAPLFSPSIRQVRPACGLAVLPSYLQAGSPSPAVPTIGLVVLTPIPQLKLAICECVIVAVQ